MSTIADARRELELLRADMHSFEREMRVYKNLLMDSTVLASQLGIKEASDIRRAITLLYQLKAAYDAVQLARMAAGDPLAWLGAGITVTSAAISLGNTFIREDASSEGPQ